MKTIRSSAAAIAAFGLFGMSAASSVDPVGIDDLIQASGAIVAGTVEDAKAYWGTSDLRWMRTAYGFRAKGILFSDAPMHPGSLVGFEYWGGTIGTETHRIGCVTPPEVGGDYLMFLQTNWRTTHTFTPVVGLNQGQFALVWSGNRREVVEMDGQPLFIDPSGRVVRSWERRKDGLYRAGVTLEELDAYVRTNAEAIRKRPRNQPPPSGQSLPSARPFFGKEPASEGVHPMEETVNLDAPEGKSGSSKDVAGKAQSGGTNPAYSFFGVLASRPVINQFQASMDPWSPEDQYQMSKWNYYCDMLRVRSDGGTGTFGWPNDRFDLCGWPDSDTLERVYGERWGSGTRGVCYYRLSGSTIIEADIALNPAFSWTLDDEWVYDGSSAKCFRRTMTHELGHVVGLNHQFNYPSVLNYQQDIFRMFGFPHMDEAEGVRVAYPAWDVARTDLGVYLYYADAYQSYDDATYNSEVVAGNDLTVNRYWVENVGSTNLARTDIEWWLAEQRNYSGTEYHLADYNYGALNRFTYFTPSGMTITPTVPQSLDGGRYYLNAYIRDDGGASQSGFPFSNNIGWSRNYIRVYPRLRDILVADPIIGGESDPTATLRLFSSMGVDSMTATLTDTSSFVSVPASIVFTSSDGTDDTFIVNTSYATAPANVTISATCKGVTVQEVFRLLVSTLVGTDNKSAPAGHWVTLRARLTRRANGTGVSGETLTFRIDGTSVGSGVTNSNGYATRMYKIPMNWSGSHTISATKTQDNDYGGSADTAILTVLRPRR